MKQCFSFIFVLSLATALRPQAASAEAAIAPLAEANALSVSARALADQGRRLWSESKRTEALEAFRKSLALDPSQTALAQWMALQEQAARAQPASLSEEDAEALEESLGEAQAALDGRRLEEAAELFSRGAKSYPKHGAFLRGLAEAQYGLERFDEARLSLDKALALDPEDPELKRMKERYMHAGLKAEGGGGSPWGSLARSVILPGWGQHRNGEKTKAWTLGGLTLGLLAATAYTYVATDQAVAEYRALGPGRPASDYDAAFGKADGLALTNNVLGICFYTAYAYNLFDAAANAPKAALPAKAQSLGPRLTLLAYRF